MKTKTEGKKTSRLFTIEEMNCIEGVYILFFFFNLSCSSMFDRTNLIFTILVCGLFSWTISENLTKIVNLSIVIYFSN